MTSHDVLRLRLWCTAPGNSKYDIWLWLPPVLRTHSLQPELQKHPQFISATVFLA